MLSICTCIVHSYMICITLNIAMYNMYKCTHMYNRYYMDKYIHVSADGHVRWTYMQMDMYARWTCDTYADGHICRWTCMQMDMYAGGRLNSPHAYTQHARNTHTYTQMCTHTRTSTQNTPACAYTTTHNQNTVNAMAAKGYIKHHDE